MYQFKRPKTEGRDKKIPPRLQGIVTPELMLRLGALAWGGRNSSFIEFPLKKPAGRIRVGCFGDSFTYGDEVGRDQDYPSHLQRMLNGLGLHQYEVINFGSPWHGFHQTYMLWEEVGQKYDLDYILIGPTALRNERSLTFNHARNESPSYIHSRYILSDDSSLLRVDVPGKTRIEVFESFSSFIPSRDLILYDRYAPFSLESIVSKWKAIPNPFYYTTLTEEQEGSELNHLLIEDIRKTGVKVIVGDHHFASKSVDTFPYVQVLNFPFLAPQRHNAPLGNYLVAAQYLRALTGIAVDIPDIDDSVDAIASSERARLNLKSLDQYDGVLLKVGNQVLGHFSNHAVSGEGDASLFRKLKVSAIIAIKAPQQSLFDVFWVPVKGTLKNGLVSLVVRYRGRNWKSDLGELLPVNFSLGMGYVETALGKLASQKKISNRMIVPPTLTEIQGEWSPGLYLDGEKLAEVEPIVEEDIIRGAVVPATGHPYLKLMPYLNKFSVEQTRIENEVRMVLIQNDAEVGLPLGKITFTAGGKT